MKANAGGTPAKFDATPENVSKGDRTPLGRPPNTTAAAMPNPTAQPSKAVMKDSLMLVQ